LSTSEEWGQVFNAYTICHIRERGCVDEEIGRGEDWSHLPHCIKYLTPYFFFYFFLFLLHPLLPSRYKKNLAWPLLFFSFLYPGIIVLILATEVTEITEKKYC